MKTAISVPDETFRRVEESAARHKMNRSEFFTKAVERYLDELDASDFTAQIDNAIEAGVIPEALEGHRLLAELTKDDEW